MNPSLPRIKPLMMLMFFLLTMISSTLSVTPVSATRAIIVVNSDQDVVADDGLCTLREAIDNANNGTQKFSSEGECAPGSDGEDTITFAGNYTITLSGGRLLITSTISIIGNGAENTIIQAADCDPVDDLHCSHSHRVFTVEKQGVLTLDGVTVRHGRSGDQGGGGIFNDGGTVHILNSVITANLASNSGGGIHNGRDSTLTITNSLLEKNKTEGQYGSSSGGAVFNEHNVSITNSSLLNNKAGGGGGIFNLKGVIITNSSLLNNKADLFGGGILNLDGSVIMTGSTLANNSADESGGGFYNLGSATIANSTFSGNNAQKLGGAIYNSAVVAGPWYGILYLKNTTISGNSAGENAGGIYLASDNSINSVLNFANTIIANSTGGDCYQSAGAVIDDNIQNLVEDGSCGGIPGNPKLGPLADNGGPTHTHALMPGSPAIDSGDPATCAAEPVNNIDQRGVPRPQGAACDIGAYESDLDYMIFLPLIVR